MLVSCQKLNPTPHRKVQTFRKHFANRCKHFANILQHFRLHRQEGGQSSHPGANNKSTPIKDLGHSLLTPLLPVLYGYLSGIWTKSWIDLVIRSVLLRLDWPGCLDSFVYPRTVCTNVCQMFAQMFVEYFLVVLEFMHCCIHLYKNMINFHISVHTNFQRASPTDMTFERGQHELRFRTWKAVRVLVFGPTSAQNSTIYLWCAAFLHPKKPSIHTHIPSLESLCWWLFHDSGVLVF